MKSYDYNSLNDHLTPLEKQRAISRDIFSLILDGMSRSKTDDVKLSNYEVNQILAEIAKRFTTLTLVSNWNLIKEEKKNKSMLH